jgi:hypothetical protein
VLSLVQILGLTLSDSIGMHLTQPCPTINVLSNNRSSYHNVYKMYFNPFHMMYCVPLHQPQRRQDQCMHVFTSFTCESFPEKYFYSCVNEFRINTSQAVRIDAYQLFNLTSGSIDERNDSFERLYSTSVRFSSQESRNHCSLWF